MRRQQQGIWMVGLVVCVAMLCAWLWFELTRELTRQTGSHSAGTSGQPGAAEPQRGQAGWTAVADVDDYAAMVERPLFSETRRPPAPQVAEPAPVSPPRPAARPDWRLVGVVIVDGQPRAVLWDEREGRYLRLREGDVANGWTAVEVEAQRLTIENMGQRHELALRRY
ncbi:hypothetical protein [Halomonas urumqiensis]|uniref:Type II secretion system protein GspC N-terminal domain-containing protein n=1 Tax=Halomonas urumqiensis TaxID=1684789 RepID=A0A2N7UP78_9GAMM|nr:hypothetical protein [Halomonas urumqiensis]PMR82253.1 hypothetical protein C1H70_03455 [Halomonas urumqiensis]PTB02969.1 hypothetical protein C6V82_00060 [Halomonas urumqiensis]GHE20914.1 hypothetical protein GCM10017767_14350 [Halomonas urumqiensis]